MIYGCPRLLRLPPSLADAYAFPGFRAGTRMRGRFGDPQIRVLTLARRAKKRAVGLAGRCIAASTTVYAARCAICRANRFVSISIWKCAGFAAADVGKGRGETRAAGVSGRQIPSTPSASRTTWASAAARRRSRTSPRNCTWTGRRSRSWTSSNMRAQVKRAGTPGPKAIGIDEISIRKAPHLPHCRQRSHPSSPDLVRWPGSQRDQHGRSSYRFIGEKKARNIRLAVMDMWKAFRNSTRHYAPQAAVKFRQISSSLRSPERSTRQGTQADVRVEGIGAKLLCRRARHYTLHR